MVKMNTYIAIVCCVIFSFSHQHIQAQKPEEQLASAIVSSNQQELATNVGQGNDDVLVLMPTTSLSVNSSQSIEPSNYNLFKLDTDVLNTRDKEAATGSDDESSSIAGDDPLSPEGLKNGHRSSRKINFLRGMWNKPKISPLYLVNGTVCRFVNSRPICTTLSTTGLLPTNSSAITSGQFGGNGQVRLQGSISQPFMGNQQFMGNQPMMDNQQQQLPYQNMNSQQQFLNNQNPSMSRQQPQRPFAALIQDEPTSEVNIGTSESSLNVSETSSSSVLPKVQQTMAATNRPLMAPQRRPALNLLGLRRPLRFANGKAL